MGLAERNLPYGAVIGQFFTTFARPSRVVQRFFTVSTIVDHSSGVLLCHRDGVGESMTDSVIK